MPHSPNATNQNELSAGIPANLARIRPPHKFSMRYSASRTVSSQVTIRVLDRSDTREYRGGDMHEPRRGTGLDSIAPPESTPLRGNRVQILAPSIRNSFLIAPAVFFRYDLSISAPTRDVMAGGNTMHYLLLIYDAESDLLKMSQAELGKMYQEYMEFTNDIKSKGNHLAGHQLQPIATATTVRVRNGKRLTTDGPFAETKEQLGGFYMIEAKDLDEAIEIASHVPSAKVGSIEVRPIVVQGTAANA